MARDFFLSIIDDFSKYKIVYPLIEKSQVFNTFVKHVNRDERFLGEKLQSLRTDNGSEFQN